MSNSRRIEANRRNAAKSTGPRTEAGKKRAARNALRHGLSLPVGALHELDGTVSSLASVIAGADRSPARLEAARRVAEAEVDLRRVRVAKLLILSGSKATAFRPRKVTVRWVREISALLDLAMRVQGGDLAVGAKMVALAEKLFPPPEIETDPEQVAARITGNGAQWLRLDRYERRALSRRKFAVREFDELGTPAS